MTPDAGVLLASVGRGSAFDIAGRCVADPAGVLRPLWLVARSPAR